MKKIIIIFASIICLALIGVCILVTNNHQKEYSKIDIKNDFVQYLESKILEDGSFKYISYFDDTKRLDDYDILRHSLSYFALLKGYENDDKKLSSQRKIIEKGIRHILNNLIYDEEDHAYIISSDSEEIIVGDCALATVLMCEYQKAYGDTQYQEIIKKLASGIISMQRLDGKFNQIYWAEWKTLKDQDRIVYYEGEAVIALCMAYEITEEEQFLESAKKAMNYYITNNFETYADHWQEYAIRELLKYCSDDIYLVYAMNNLREKVSQIERNSNYYNTDLETLKCGIEIINKSNYSGDNTLIEKAKLLYNDGLHEIEDKFNSLKTNKNRVEQYFEQKGKDYVRIDEIAHYILAL